MWLFTSAGFFSIKRKSGRFHVRARRRADLENLKRISGVGSPIVDTPSGDYPVRLIVGQAELGAIMRSIGKTVVWNNGKGKKEDGG